MRKSNNICPICRLERIFSKPSKVTNIYNNAQYGNKVALTPPMGWSSWNTFKNRIDQELIYESAVALKEKGLLDAGYQYINIDDNWVSPLRDKNGDLQGDLTTFSEGIPSLVKKVNELGIKLGIYSSNGTETCEDLPASLYHEREDALTFARWGIEYFKYDFCHNVPISSYAPLVYAVEVVKRGEREGQFVLCKEARLEGFARFMTCKALDGGQFVSGLDRNEGAMVFDNLSVDDAGEYVLTVHIFKKGQYRKALMAQINDAETYMIDFPSQKHYNVTAKFQVPVQLKKGVNKVRLFNPIGSLADSAMLQYQNMGKQLMLASKQVAEENHTTEKPIVFSICEWGLRQPYKWGATAGNLWRTTPDIRPVWSWIMVIYLRNVRLYKHAQIGAWNDPDMLEVGNGNLTYDENVSHFSLWCMMASPLILGNDIRKITQNVLDIVTNKNLIAINQDKLGIQAKRIISGKTDVLVKPLADGSTAVCVLNRANRKKKYQLKLSDIYKDEYAQLKKASSYEVVNQWSDERVEVADKIEMTLNPHGCTVYKISPKK